jgi:exo-beta-1,3-glucanase (GH17 family)
MNPTKRIILCTIFLATLCIPYCTASDAAVIGLNGTCFSPYKDGQRPPDPISPLQIEERLAIISDYNQWIRTFGCTNGLENTGKIAHNKGLKTAIGAWIDDNLAVNELEIKNLIKVANEGDVNIAVVGNERILTNTSPDWNPRKLINKTQLIDYITRVKQNTGIYVTTAEPWHIWRDNPDLIDAVDVLFVNIYPYHEGQPIDNAIQFTEEKYNLVRNLAGSKPVIISEMGWPSAGNANGAAVPSMGNATYYFINITKWAKDNNIQYFYFEAFDEQWKSYDDQWVYHPDWAYQSHWGIWNSNGTQKLPVVNPKMKDRIGIYKDGQWRLDYSGNGRWDGGVIDRKYTFGMTGSVPVTGDWNNDC